MATLTGSIIARNRSLVTRIILPPVLFAVSAKHFLPQTTRNLSDYLGSIEDSHFPKFAEKHDIANAHTTMTWERIKEATKDTRTRVNHGAVVAVEKVQEATGLKLRETLGWAGETKEHVKTTTVEVEGVVERAITDARAAVEQKVDEIREEVAAKVGHVEGKAEQVEQEAKTTQEKEERLI